MKRKILIVSVCLITLCLAACGKNNKQESESKTESTSNTITKEQALEAIKEYCFAHNPDLEDMNNSDEYTIYWDVNTNEEGEIVVLYRSYTGAQTRYYINPDSGETYVTELVPGIIDDEQRTDESFNVRDYIK